jgi:hypothetical protein
MAWSVSPGASLREQHDRKALLLGQLEHTVLLQVIHRALGARQHRVVVGHDRALCACVAEQVSVDTTDPSDHAIGRRALDQVLDRSAPSLRGNDQCTVLDERSVIDEVRDILARGALFRLTTLRNCLRPVLVEAKRMPFVQSNKGSPAATVASGRTSTRLTTPLCSAATMCSIFIASRINSV